MHVNIREKFTQKGNSGLTVASTTALVWTEAPVTTLAVHCEYIQKIIFIFFSNFEAKKDIV